jgi:MFS superfamily sulfate permease-like transporter
LTARSLRKAGQGKGAITLPHNADQELIALGVSNIIGGCFLALPAFGGYGRSKLNFSTGGRTPMSNVLLSIMTLLCILFLLPAFYFLPRGVLAAMIAVVGVSMVEECPHEILFFAKIRAWPELALMAAVFAAMVFHSVSLGMALGLGWSILALFIFGGWRTTLRILDSRSPKAYEDEEFAQIATLCPMRTILVTIPGPLTFVNTNNLKDRIDALEHVAQSKPPICRPDSRPPAMAETALIFDMRHCTKTDGCAIQVLTEITEEHAVEGNRIIIWEPLQLHGMDPIQHKLALSGALDSCGENVSFVTSLGEMLTELGAEGSLESRFESMDV